MTSVPDLAAKLATNADAETKAFLAAVLKASEAQAAELAAVRKSLETSEAERKGAETEARDKMLRADLRTAAKEAGAVNAGDILAFVDVAEVTLGADGAPTNLADLVKNVKEAKPYLFSAANTSATHMPPPAKTAEARHASELKPAEYNARLRELGVDANKIRRR
ncbi:MAG TPA: phage scaffolding protein [Acidocella sp.]|nr:phage scaffolding protein [Acidocella sp.]